MKLVWDLTYYIPLLASLKKYLSNGHILEEVRLTSLSRNSTSYLSKGRLRVLIPYPKLKGSG